MAQISYGTITITDTTDIERIYPVYCKGGETTAPALQPLSNWSEIVSQAGGDGDYIWQRIVTKKQDIAVTVDDYSDAVRLTGDDGAALTILQTQYAQTQNENDTPSYGNSMPSSINEGWWLWVKTIYSDNSEVVIKTKQGQKGDQGYSVTNTRELYYLKTNSTTVPQITNSNQITNTDRQNGWTSIVPTYVTNGSYYTCIETTLNSPTNNLKWSAPVINNALTDTNRKASEAYDATTARDTEVNALKAQAKHFWWDSEGAHIAAGQNTTSVDNITQGQPDTYTFNALTAPGYLKLRYKNIDFAQLATNSLTFYRPAVNGSTYVQGKKAMDLTADALTFYKPLAYNSSNEPTAAATLNTNGLILSEGGVQAGTAGQSGFIYLSTKNYGSNLTINNHTASNWREIIGTKFGVDADGNLYASNAEISGKITVGSGSDLSAGLSDYSTTSQMNSAIGTATNDMATKTYVGSQGYQNASQVNTIIENKGYALNSDLTTEINQRKAQYGTSSTSASTKAKVVTCANFELIAGNEITVKFSTANTYVSNSVQLNVNGKGAKDIWVANAVTSSTNQLLWGANAYITFKYDGTQFIVIGEPRTWYGASTTAAATAAKTDTTAVTGCVICKGAKIELAMANNNTNTSATLNIQSTGAKNIYYGNTTTSPTVDNGHSWLGTSTATFTFDGQYYRMAGQTVISGDSITTGTIAANRLDVYDASINKISASAIDVGSIQIGQSQVNNLTTELGKKANSSDSNWSISIATSGTPDYTTPSVTLVATIYHNGAIATSGFSTPQWYKNGSTTALSGATYANGKSTITVTDVDAYYTCTISSN